jgi:uncharacterized integral membrane protein
MRQGLARTGGVLAIGLSALWTIPAAGFIVFGVLLLFADDDGDTEGFAEFFGGSLAGVGVLVLACAVGGILLGIRLRRGRDGARVGLALLFTLFALVSGSFLASSIADDTGVDPGGVVAFGLNTAICLVVVLAALVGRPD